MRKLLNEELNRLSVAKFKGSDKIPLVLVLDNVRSLMNVGSIFRTADSFRIGKLYLCGITGRPPHREIQKSALGATDSVAWTYREQTRQAILELKEEGFSIAGIEQVDESVYLDNFIPEHHKKYALVFGNEINGISEDIVDLLDLAIEIPQFGTKHSFNVAVSAGIILWHFYFSGK